jgi:hypothetical protein
MTVQRGTRTLSAIEAQLEGSQGIGWRTHLGASLIGRECNRQLWYVFRWAKRVRHKARLLRLFDRGNREEERFLQWLRTSGIHVLGHDPGTGNQFRIVDHNEHFGGSLDALIFDAPDFPNEWILGEFKTHNNKSYNEVVKKGVKAAKFEHYVQMQIYMRKYGLRVGLYFAINKDNDDLDIQIVWLDEIVADQHIDRAGKIILAPLPPRRISEDPTWFRCNMCDFRAECHYGAPLAVNCRTCIFSEPIADGKWVCTKFQKDLPEGLQRTGCSSHTPIVGQ